MIVLKYLLKSYIHIERSNIRLRTLMMGLSKREIEKADRIARRLWPGLVPIPHEMKPRAEYPLEAK